MPLSAVVKFTPQEKMKFDVSSGEQVHAFFLNLINAENPRLSERLHNDARSKPFSVSPIINPDRTGKFFSCRPGEDYFVRFATVSDEIATSLKETFMMISGLKKLYLFNIPVTVREIFLTRTGHPLAGYCSYQELLQEESVRDFSLIFHTPCAFRMKGKNLPLPLPEKIFKGYFYKWQDFSPVKFGINEDDLTRIIENDIAITRYNIKTDVARFSRSIQIGFRGKVSFKIKSKDAGCLQILSSLAKYSFFAGTGYKSTMGMGQTEFVSGMGEKLK